MKYSYWIAALMILMVGFFWLFQPTGNFTDEAEPLLFEYVEVERYSSDVVLTEAKTIAAGEALVVTNDAMIKTDEALTIDGAIGCVGDSLVMEVNGPLTINGLVVCEGSGSGNGDITIIAAGGLVMSPEAMIVADGSVQLVDDVSVVRQPSELDQLYAEVETIPEANFAIGPLVADEIEVEGTEAGEIISTQSVSWLPTLIKTAQARVNNGTTTVNLTGEPIIVSGRLKVNTPTWAGAKRIVVFDFPHTSEVTIQDFELVGPAGRTGEAKTDSCDVVGGDGEDAFRFNAVAPSLVVNNFTLILGDGGAGGDATTGHDCQIAKAKGGNGGKSGNFRMIGNQNFEIKGGMTVHPGVGGAGGNATAKGKAGAPGEQGGEAEAIGGDGADNKKKLSVIGTVAGTNNVTFGDAVGGAGGAASAEGGKGGDAPECGQVGGAGGRAIAKSGAGGDARLTLTGGAVRMEVANDIGGQGGWVDAVGGAGGKGGDCDATQKGGAGGVGGHANATPGQGGLGQNGRASDGPELADDGGAGGPGGEGCPEGSGGNGGTGGMEDGEQGPDGRNICITVTKEEDYVSLVPGEIEVIQHKDYLIPLSNLSVVGAHEPYCDGDHYHPGPNGAINLRGMAVPDPNSDGCGFGKVSEVEVKIVMDPNYQPETAGDTTVETEGQMIQIEPPKLIIPVN